MRRDSTFRAMRRTLVVFVIVLVCLTGCQATRRQATCTGASAARGEPKARDLRIERSVRSTETYQLDSQTIRIYWAGENTFAVDSQVHGASRQALIRYLSRQPQVRLQNGVLLVAATGSKGFDPLDTLSQWCLKHDVSLYCVALTGGEPAEPAVQDTLSAGDWRSELPGLVQCVVQASTGRTAAPHQASAADSPVAAGPVAAR